MESRCGLKVAEVSPEQRLPVASAILYKKNRNGNPKAGAVEIDLV
jgi:hypothetical protein